MRFLLRFGTRWTLVGVLFLLAAEATARLDDWIHFGTPFYANPDRGYDLTMHDSQGAHGRPHGRFKKWILNNYGFRGPDMEVTPPAGVTRVMVLGASETFGLYESADKEYPAQLREQLQQRNVEVVNVAMAGVTLKSMLPYWTKWVARFRPEVVLIYPSPLFYVDNEPPKTPSAEPPPSDEGAPHFTSRFAGRVEDALRGNNLLRRLNREWTITKATQGRPDDWVFRVVPRDRLEQFTADLDQLVQAIQQSGAKVILITHAMGAGSPPRPEDEFNLLGMRQFMPRTTPETLVAFEDAAAQEVRDYGKRRGIVVIDAAKQFNGQREHFADLVHFNDEGATIFAGFLAEQLTADVLAPCKNKAVVGSH